VVVEMTTIAKAELQSVNGHVIGFRCSGVVKQAALDKIDTLVSDLDLGHDFEPTNEYFLRRMLLVDSDRIDVATYNYNFSKGIAGSYYDPIDPLSDKDQLCQLQVLIRWVEEQNNGLIVTAIEVADQGEGYATSSVVHETFSAISLKNGLIQGASIVDEEEFISFDSKPGNFIYLNVGYDRWERLGFEGCLIFHLSRK
jgi:hypothetical protein